MSSSRKKPEDLASFEKIPEELARKIADYLSLDAASKSARASKDTNTIFSRRILEKKTLVNELFSDVKKSNFTKFLSLLEGRRSKPNEYGLVRVDFDTSRMRHVAEAIMLKKGRLENEDSKSSDEISPLQLAFKLYDTRMWRVFRRLIDSTKFIPGGKHYNDLLKEFVKQAKEQKEHVDLKPLFAKYKNFTDQYALWMSKKLSGEDIIKAWLEVGKKQREVLPQHMLDEFCCGREWSMSSRFDAGVNNVSRVENGRIYSMDKKETIEIAKIANRDSRLGIDFTLVRGAPPHDCILFNGFNGTTVSAMLFGAVEQNAKEDCSILRNLYVVREWELNKEILEIEEEIKRGLESSPQEEQELGSSPQKAQNKK
ncbi:MAG: hypothetical protein ACD_60C00021G0003 [uncultured bacterium]|nr:MAG: hypothetical protein ACD_60C00021G0003 [uncultured bacterium]